MNQLRKNIVASTDQMSLSQREQIRDWLDLYKVKQTVQSDGSRYNLDVMSDDDITALSLYIKRVMYIDPVHRID